MTWLEPRDEGESCVVGHFTCDLCGAAIWTNKPIEAGTACEMIEGVPWAVEYDESREVTRLVQRCLAAFQMPTGEEMHLCTSCGERVLQWTGAIQTRADKLSRVLGEVVEADNQLQRSLEALAEDLETKRAALLARTPD